MPRLIFLTLIAWLSGAAQAQSTAYVAECDAVNLRAAADADSRVLLMLPIGSAVSVLDQGEQGTYTRVREGEGREGWVATRFLTADPRAADRVATLENRLAVLERENEEQRQVIWELQARHTEVEQGNAAALTDLEAELERLRGRNTILEDDTQQRWFVAGAGVLGFGLVVGLLVAGARKPRRWGSSW